MQSKHNTLGFSMLRTILTNLLLLLSLQIFANNINKETDVQINEFYKQIKNQTYTNISSKVSFIAKQFIGKPYELGALGEGADAYFDQAPLYRIDAFDCETYVDTVLALSFANNLATFKQYIQLIRYNEGHVSFISRNHFTCLDWNKNNQKQNFIKDITQNIIDKNNKPYAKIAHALINKPSWYQHFSINHIRLNEASRVEKFKRLNLLKQKGKKLPIIESHIPYIPLTALFSKDGHANNYIFQQIPNGSIIEIVRPNWDLIKEIGTHLNISHLGFATWENGTLYFIQASSTMGHVVQVPLIEYLRQTLQSPSIKGINIETIAK